MINIILAISQNNVIGRSNQLPWYLPADLKYFATKTKTHNVIMGRKTYESILSKIGQPLPARTNIVISRQSDYPVDNNVILAHSLEEAIKRANQDKEIFIIGGAQIYKQALPLADKVYLTRIHSHTEGDIYFNDFIEDNWRLVSEEFHPKNGRNIYDYSFLVYEKKE